MKYTALLLIGSMLVPVNVDAAGIFWRAQPAAAPTDDPEAALSGAGGAAPAPKQSGGMLGMFSRGQAAAPAAPAAAQGIDAAYEARHQLPLSGRQVLAAIAAAKARNASSSMTVVATSGRALTGVLSTLSNTRNLAKTLNDYLIALGKSDPNKKKVALYKVMSLMEMIGNGATMLVAIADVKVYKEDPKSQQMVQKALDEFVKAMTLVVQTQDAIVKGALMKALGGEFARGRNERSSIQKAIANFITTAAPQKGVDIRPMVIGADGVPITKAALTMDKDPINNMLMYVAWIALGEAFTDNWKHAKVFADEDGNQRIVIKVPNPDPAGSVLNGVKSLSMFGSVFSSQKMGQVRGVTANLEKMTEFTEPNPTDVTQAGESIVFEIANDGGRITSRAMSETQYNAANQAGDYSGAGALDLDQGFDFGDPADADPDPSATADLLR